MGIKCRDYLKQPNLTHKQLYVYTEHLFRAHRQNLPRTIKLVRLATSASFNQRAYDEVDALAAQVESSYAQAQRG